MGLLGEIFSAGDGAKRKLKGLLSDPLGELGLLGNRMAEDIQNQLDVYSKAYPLDPRLNPRLDTAQGREMVVDQNVARNKLAEMAANMGMAGTFIGPTARTWDALAAKRAQDLYAKKVDPRIIWKETGTFKGPDGMWRQEIDDSLASVHEPSLRHFEAAQATNPLRMDKVSGVLSHKPAYNAYKDLQDIGLDMTRPEKGGAYAAATSWGDPEAIALGPGAGKSTLLHELQHAIQQREGWARGGSPQAFGQQKDAELARDALSWRQELLSRKKKFPNADDIALENAAIQDYQAMGAMDWLPSREARDLARQPRVLFPEKYTNDSTYKDLQELVQLYGLDKSATPARDMDLYRRLAGEAEARATQSRMNMDAAKRREVFPLDSYDVPLNELIIRLGAKP